MKKILFLLFCFLFCGCSTSKATQPVEDYLNKYKNHDVEVMKSLEQLIVYENLDVENQDLYRLIMKRQYQDLTFKTVSEYYNGDEAKIQEEIEVYDYHKSTQDAFDYYEKNKDHFTKEQYQKLQLDKMYHEKRRTKYTLDFALHFDKDHWQLISPDYTVLQKIHGIYETN